jgi:hypothetical protein
VRGTIISDGKAGTMKDFKPIVGELRLVGANGWQWRLVEVLLETGAPRLTFQLRGSLLIRSMSRLREDSHPAQYTS